MSNADEESTFQIAVETRQDNAIELFKADRIHDALDELTKAIAVGEKNPSYARASSEIFDTLSRFVGLCMRVPQANQAARGRADALLDRIRALQQSGIH